MDSDEKTIEVVYATSEEQFVDRLVLTEGLTARGALRISRIPERFPGLDAQRCPLGVWGKEVPGDYLLSPGDRLEVYRPLPNDPRDERRQRAAQGKTMGSNPSTRLD